MKELQEMQILLVDDSEVIRISIDYLVRKKVRMFTAVGNTAEAVAVLRQCRGPLVIIADYQVPGTNGIEFFKQVQQEYRNFIFVLITAYGSHKIQEQAFREGIDLFVEKPFTSEMIMQVLLSASDKLMSLDLTDRC